MAFSKSIGSRRQAILFASLAIVLVMAIVRWRPGGGDVTASSSRTAPPRPGGRPDALAAIDEPARGRRAAVREVNADDVPVLEVGDFSPAPSPRGATDPGRDLFDLREPTRRPPPPATPPPPVPGDGRFVGPPPPPPPTPTPRPPEISFKFIGTFGSREHPIAVVQQGDQVLNVRAGDTLFGKYVLRRVGYESIDVGFLGFPVTETKRLGITP